MITENLRDFFPTNSHTAHRVIARAAQALEGKEQQYFLDPSAGKGDLAQAIQRRWPRGKVDCIEPVPELATLLMSKGFTVVGYDWLDYSGVCYYDAIVINPPFSAGVHHLLKAWDFLHSGVIVCLLNQETINNPYSIERQRLTTIINQHGEVESLGPAFASDSERTTGVHIAMVTLTKQLQDDAPDIFADLSNERTPDDGGIPTQDQLPAIIDELGNMQHYYDMANENMLRAFHLIRKASIYMQANGISNSDYGKSDFKEIVGLALNNVNAARAEFAQVHRKKAWMRVFDKMHFRRWLDKKQTDDIIRQIERSANIPFTAANIKGTLENVFLQRIELFEKSVANVFDELTRYFNGNTTYREGWKTNDSYKVNMKLIFPYGCSFSYGSFSMNYHGVIDVYNDLDRILCVLDGKDFEKCATVGKQMTTRFSGLGHNPQGYDNTLESEYFHIRFFKKGTVHLKFKDTRLWEQFNITASKGKKWLGERTQEK